MKPHFNRSNAQRQASYEWCATNQARNREEGLTAVAQATESYNAKRTKARGED